jgi:hypothetical protein
LDNFPNKKETKVFTETAVFRVETEETKTSLEHLCYRKYLGKDTK